MATTASTKAPKLTDDERGLFTEETGMTVYINALLHRRLKILATTAGRSLREVAEEHLWPAVGGKPEEI